MNPCIQQLAEQAAEQAIFDDLDLCMITEADSGQLLQVPAAFVQRFAELIVRECASIASGTAVENPPNDLFYGYNLGVNKTAEKIREHFGVEE
jgi:hypothetical protein